MRRLQSGEWSEFQGFVSLAIQPSIGLTFRDSDTASILCDIPRTAIQSIELESDNQIFNRIEKTFIRDSIIGSVSSGRYFD